MVDLYLARLRNTRKEPGGEEARLVATILRWFAKDIIAALSSGGKNHVAASDSDAGSLEVAECGVGGRQRRSPSRTYRPFIEGQQRVGCGAFGNGAFRRGPEPWIFPVAGPGIGCLGPN